jgi:hypothetical protein
MRTHLFRLVAAAIFLPVSAMVFSQGINAELGLNIDYSQWTTGVACSDDHFYTHDFENLSVAPGDSVWLNLGWMGSVTSNMFPGTGEFTTPLCVFTSHPNRVTDLNVPNDQFCGSIVVNHVGLKNPGCRRLSCSRTRLRG